MSRRRYAFYGAAALALAVFGIWRASAAEETSLSVQHLATSVGNSSRKVLAALERQSQALVEHRADPALYEHESHLARDAIGVYTNGKRTMRSNVYLPRSSTVTPEFREFLVRTDYLED